MRKLFALLFVLLFAGIVYAASTYTTNLNLEKPARSDREWHTPTNNNWDAVDTALGTQHDTSGNHLATYPDANNTRDLGTSALRWKDIYGAGTITGGTLTDGTFSVTSGAITGASGNISQWTNNSNYFTSVTLTGDVGGTATGPTAIVIVNLSNDAVREENINFGTKTGQVSAIDLPDFGTMTQTLANVLVSDGTNINSNPMSGDAVMVGGDGTINIANTAVSSGNYYGADVTIAADGRITSATKKKFPISVTITKPLSLDEADTLPIWTNRTGKTYSINSIYSNSDTDDVDFTLKEVTDPHDFTALTTIEAITIATNGTGVFYDDRVSGIDHVTIEDTHIIVFDNDAADDPNYINFVIVGTFD